jgi:dUTP pyrophosphatase|tara:strand:- start:1211 stop:1651 length:441 start_codon:yes stop_codon:yes gene_type:complete
MVEIVFNDPRAEERGIPDYATDGSAGLDLRSCDTCQLMPGESWGFHLGISIWIKDPSICGVIMPRSGLGIQGILPANVVGLIDSDYQGELIIHLANYSDKEYVVQNGDRIAQLVFMPVRQMSFQIKNKFTELTERGEGGFGSTGNE